MMVKISDCFHYIVNLLCYVMTLAGMIRKLDRFLENVQIVQCSLQIGWPIYQLADWPGQFANRPDWQIGRNIYIHVWPWNYYCPFGCFAWTVGPQNWRDHGWTSLSGWNGPATNSFIHVRRVRPSRYSSLFEQVPASIALVLTRTRWVQKCRKYKPAMKKPKILCHPGAAYKPSSKISLASIWGKEDKHSTSASFYVYGCTHSCLAYTDTAHFLRQSRFFITRLRTATIVCWLISLSIWASISWMNNIMIIAYGRDCSLVRLC